MKIHKYFLNLIILVNFNIFSIKIYCQEDSLNSTKYKVYEFVVSNSHQDSFGYKEYSDDESIGVKSIVVDNNFAYTIDVYHNNVKRINLSNGSIESSPSISKHFGGGTWFRDIAVFNDTIYVTSDLDSVYSFSMDMKYHGAFKLGAGPDKYVYKITQDSLVFYLNTSQLKDLSDLSSYLVIDKKGKRSVIRIHESNKHVSDSSSIRFGKKFYIFDVDGKSYFKDNLGEVKLKEHFKNIDAYSARNVAFTNKYFVYFETTPNKFILYVYKR